MVSWCGGKDSVMFTVSVTHPRRTWQVEHVQSPVNSFFSDNTSLQLFESPESQVLNALSRARNKVFHTWRRGWAGPWASPR